MGQIANGRFFQYACTRCRHPYIGLPVNASPLGPSRLLNDSSTLLDADHPVRYAPAAMHEYDEETQPIREERPSLNGCSGFLFLFILTVFIASTVYTDNTSVATTTSPVATAVQFVLASVTPTAVNTPTLAPTTTNTPTPLPTNTATATHTPTNTATPTATFLPGVPTFTPDPATATPTPMPLPTPRDGFSYTIRVPILMYHYISTPPEDADVYRTDLSVEPDNFLTQMTYLAQNGYNPIDFYDLSLAITGQKELPPKPVIITLDDGYRDQYENAFPVLREFGFTATIFIVTEFVDRGYEPYMTWEMIEEMATAGIRFEPHSRTHADLRDRDRDFLIWEILGPQETLAAHLGYTPRYFSYPSGWYDEAVIGMLQELDFWGAVTTASGKEHGFADRYQWTRLRVRHNTPLLEFIDLVAPGASEG